MRSSLDTENQEAELREKYRTGLEDPKRGSRYKSPPQVGPKLSAGGGPGGGGF
jgi:hypothetical protein